MTGIYAIKNIISKKFYVGSSVNIKKRWEQHRTDLRRNAHHCGHLQNAWNKYGEKVFEFSILEEVEPQKLLITEQEWLDRHWSLSVLYNSCSTVESPWLGKSRSEECKAKISKTLKGRRLSTETIEKMRVSKLGVPFSEEHKKNISIGAIGRRMPPRTKEHQEKLSMALKGKPKTMEHNQKVSDAIKLWWIDRKSQSKFQQTYFRFKLPKEMPL